MNERRSHDRRPYPGQAYLTFDGRCRCEDVVDVSPTGIQLRTGARLRPGTDVRVFLPIQRGEAWRMCLLKARVVRRAGGRGDRRLAMTLVEDAVDTRALLAEYCAN